MRNYWWIRKGDWYEEKGDTSFGYDCIFLSDDLSKTFGEVTSEEKNKVSHRSRAIEQIKEII